MSIRTEGDMVAASNLACELSMLVARYLGIYRQHANGVNGVTIPHTFTVVLKKPTQGQDGTVRVNCTLIHEYTTSYEVPTYYSPDDDNFVEGFGASNVSGYETRTDSSIEQAGVSIPWGVLLMSEAQQIDQCRRLKAKDEADRAEAARQQEVARLKARLAALEPAAHQATKEPK